MSQPKIRTKQTNNSEIKIREEGGKRFLSGYCAVFDEPAELWEDGKRFVEVLRPGCFREAISEQRIRLCTDHIMNNVLGISPESVTFAEDQRGVYFNTEIGTTQLWNDTLSRIERREYLGCSYNFYPTLSEIKISQRGGKEFHEVLKIVGISEFSVVYDPAYPGTSAYTRSKSQMMADDLELLEAEIFLASL